MNKGSMKPKLDRKKNKMRNKIRIKTQIDAYNNNNLIHTPMGKAIILITKMKTMLVISLFNLIEIYD